MTLDELFNSTGKINGKKLCVFRSTEEYLHILKETEKHKPASVY